MGIDLTTSETLTTSEISKASEALETSKTLATSETSKISKDYSILKKMCKDGSLDDIKKFVFTKPNATLESNLLRNDVKLCKELFWIACKYDKIEIVVHLYLALFYVPRGSECRGLYLACRFNAVSVVDFLLLMGTLDLSTDGYRCLTLACRYENAEIFKMLYIEIYSPTLTDVLANFAQ
jgi:hypothetical protein